MRWCGRRPIVLIGAQPGRPKPISYECSPARAGFEQGAGASRAPEIEPAVAAVELPGPRNGAGRPVVPLEDPGDGAAGELRRVPEARQESGDFRVQAGPAEAQHGPLEGRHGVRD